MTDIIFTTGWWDYNIATTPPPVAGQIRTSPATTVVGQPITIYLHATDDDGLYWFTSAAPFAGELIRLRGTSGAIQFCTITSYTLVGSGPTAYATIQAMVNSSNQEMSKTARVEVSLIRPVWLNLTQEEYDALDPPNPNVLYIITSQA